MRTATIRTNSERRGIEIFFNGMPSQTARDEIKSLGFKWNHKTKVWYIRNTKKNMDAALNYCEKFNAGKYNGPLYEKREADPERENLIKRAIEFMNREDPEHAEQNIRDARRATNQQLLQILAWA